MTVKVEENIRLKVTARFKQELGRGAGKANTDHGYDEEKEGDCDIQTCIENLNTETFDLDLMISAKETSQLGCLNQELSIGDGDETSGRTVPDQTEPDTYNTLVKFRGQRLLEHQNHQ